MVSKWLSVPLVFLAAVMPLKAFSLTSSLEVTIQSANDRYSLKENLNVNGWEGGFRLSFIVKNVSSTRQEFGYWSCSYYDNWKTNNAQATLLAWTCKGNFVSPKVLEPGESFVGKVPIQVGAAPMGKEVAFRLAFVPYSMDEAASAEHKPLGTFWSNEIRLEVVE